MPGGGIIRYVFVAARRFRLDDRPRSHEAHFDRASRSRAAAIPRGSSFGDKARESRREGRQEDATMG